MACWILVRCAGSYLPGLSSVNRVPVVIRFVHTCVRVERFVISVVAYSRKSTSCSVWALKPKRSAWSKIAANVIASVGESVKSKLPRPDFQYFDFLSEPASPLATNSAAVRAWRSRSVVFIWRLESSNHRHSSLWISAVDIDLP
ncbi:hypothetical protein D3C84_898110 [compost metagenome]